MSLCCAGAMAHRWCRAAGWGSEIVSQDAAYRQGTSRGKAVWQGAWLQCWDAEEEEELHKTCFFLDITWSLFRAWAEAVYNPQGPWSAWCMKAPLCLFHVPLKILLPVLKKFIATCWWMGNGWKKILLSRDSKSLHSFGTKGKAHISHPSSTSSLMSALESRVRTFPWDREHMLATYTKYVVIPPDVVVMLWSQFLPAVPSLCFASAGLPNQTT